MSDVILAAVGFVAAAIGAITGGNSLLTVPTMLLLDMDPKTAVATNMLGVTCLSAGAAARFLRERVVPAHPTAGLVAGAIPASIVGALVTLALPDRALRAIISLAMLGMAVLVTFQPAFGEVRRTTGRGQRAAGYGLMAVWAVYGGMFSGGYTTVLTLACVFLFGCSLVESVALTKIVNFVGSAAATGVFALERRIDWRVGLTLSIAMVAGGWVGAHLALRAGVLWVRRIFVAVVVVLGLKLLVDTVAGR